MTILRPFLADDILPTEVTPPQWMGLTLKELMIVLGAVAVVTLLLVIWAVYFRKRPHRHHHHHHDHHSEGLDDSVSTSDSADSADEGERRYRRKRRRRREHRPRNPTLAETGGLPPLRSERPPDPLP